MSKQHLLEYDEAKWDWTRSAAAKFMNGFKRFDGFNHEKEQIFIGVYGPTQVGKTTFILSLLGIDFYQLAALSDALRGGQAKGKSATVTCTIFQKTDDQFFRIQWPSGEKFICSALNEVEQVMRCLRQRIYRVREFSLEPLIIDIPKQYFNIEDVDQRIRDLAIIDLPGDDSKDELEMRHVNRILKEYIPRCKVNIIMEIASQMTALTKLGQELVKDWRVLPEQFRILLTRSVTNGSLKKAIEAGSVQTADEFVTVYKEELRRVSGTGELTIEVYPLEFGDSWADLRDSYPALYEKVDPWLRTIFMDLVEDLTSIGSPEQEIKKLKSMERKIVEEGQAEVAKLKEEKAKLDLQFEDMNLLLAKLNKMAAKERATIAQFQNFLDGFPSVSDLKIPNCEFLDWDELDYAQKKASYLSLKFRGELADLEARLREYTDGYNRMVTKFNLYENTKIPLMTFPDKVFDVSLNLDYVLDRYFKKTTYAVDCSWAEGKLSDVFQQYKSSYSEAVEMGKKVVQDYMDRLKSVCESYDHELAEQKVSKLNLEGDINAVQEKIRQAESDWHEDVKRARQLDLFLMEGFVEQSNQFKTKLLDEQASKEEKWLVHQYWNVLKDQAERIIDYVD